MVKLAAEIIALPNGLKLAFLRAPSYFDPQNHPFIYLPVADFSYKAINDEVKLLMIRVIDGLLDKYKSVKGLIHAISYDMARYICEYSCHQDRLISHSSAETRAEALEQLIQSEAPLVLVSPSFERGIDLSDDKARFQIIVKLPFMHLKDKQVQKRYFSGKGGKHWYNLECARALVQMAGRIVRSANDYGTTYILDERWPRFYRQMEKDFPEWFKEACQW